MTTTIYKKEKNMKNRTKSTLLYIISIAVCASLAFCILAPHAYANDASESKAEDAMPEEDEAEAVNIFESLYELLGEYIGEVMCALTLLGSLILTILYKRGLMPFMTRTVGAIGSTIAGIKESTESYAVKSGEDLGEIKASLCKAQSAVNQFSERLIAIEQSLTALGIDKSDRELFNSAIECQSTLLYEILMSSAIPQYQKDAVGEKLGAIKSALSALNAGGNEK